ncbi:acyl-CoA N-acyltransferase [Mycena pura]|uniref:Acyl-CoA N-acyltransferase n=1 Tax=Mycena pura TaxID=153505 RepID=A0AAD6YSG3_9AGAR|nr:acyl-CoA N-acyltransferase [Mycena pura]
MWKVVSTEVVYARGDEEIIRECHRIRKEVFHLEQGFPLDTEYDDVEDVATHFLLRVTESDTATGAQTVKAVGTIRVTTPEIYRTLNRYKLSRLAVDRAYREHRFGRRLVEHLHDWVRADARATNRRAEIECHSQIPVMGFYAKFGYRAEGPQFDEDGAPHQNMILDLPLTDANSDSTAD